MIAIYTPRRLRSVTSEAGNCKMRIGKELAETVFFMKSFETVNLQKYSYTGLFCTDNLLPCGLVVRVPGYRMEMYCASCEVRTQFIYVT
jgi:hypothetical protein